MAEVDFHQEGEIAIVTINRPKALNALNSSVLEGLKDVFKKIDTNTVRAVIVTGEGEKSFVAGADIAEMSAMSEKEGYEFAEKGSDVFRMIETFPVPVIAAVNGFALGGGCELSMSCDIRLASENAVFGQPEVGLGITPGFGGTQRLSRLIPEGKAKELLYTAKNIKAEEAKALGLVNAVYPIAELMNEAKKLALRIASNAPFAVRMAKKCVNEGKNVSIEKGLKIEAKYFSECFNTQDQKNGMKAFLNKEKVSHYENK